jgi:dCTP deaminase
MAFRSSSAPAAVCRVEQALRPASSARKKSDCAAEVYDFSGGSKPDCDLKRGPEGPLYPNLRSRMSIKSDRWIRKMATEHDMINPFSEKQIREGVISFGLSSYGYDLRVADEFKVFTNVNSTIVDPKKFDERSFVSIQTDVAIIPPNSFALARSVEYFKIPRDVLTICVGKSTYARCGIIVNVTPFEPEWEGFVTLEISNTTPLPARIYANEGLCQILFFQSDEQCETSYKDRRGKYQGQKGIVLPKL